MDDVQAAWLELKARVDELGAERQQYQEIFEHAPLAYVVTDAAGVIVAANGAAVDLLGRRRRALQGKPLAALVPLTQRRAFRERLSLAAAKGGSSLPWSTLIRADEAVVEVSLAVRKGARNLLCWRLTPAG